jgi:hypothetical protein
LSKMDQIVKILDSITISSALHSEDANWPQGPLATQKIIIDQYFHIRM